MVWWRGGQVLGLWAKRRCADAGVQMLVCRCWCSLFAPARATFLRPHGRHFCARTVAKMSAWGRRRGRREEEEEEVEEEEESLFRG